MKKCIENSFLVSASSSSESLKELHKKHQFMELHHRAGLRP